MLTMKLACLLLSIVVASVSAFGVLTRQSRAVSTPRRAFVPKPTFILFAEEDDEDKDEEDPLLDDVVEDDEWMKLTIELTDALFGEVKRVVDRVVDDEDKEKLKKAGKEIEVFVKAEVEKIRMDAKADLSKFNSELTNKIETEVRNVSGDQDFSLEDYKKEAEARIMAALTDFAVGKATMEGLRESIAKRVEDRVEEAKDSARYEFWKFKKALEREQDKKLKKVLSMDEKNFFSELLGLFQN